MGLAGMSNSECVTSGTPSSYRLAQRDITLYGTWNQLFEKPAPRS
jgi:hypothetical protein